MSTDHITPRNFSHNHIQKCINLRFLHDLNTLRWRLPNSRVAKEPDQAHGKIHPDGDVLEEDTTLKSHILLLFYTARIFHIEVRSDCTPSPSFKRRSLYNGTVPARKGPSSLISPRKLYLILYACSCCVGGIHGRATRLDCQLLHSLSSTSFQCSCIGNSNKLGAAYNHYIHDVDDCRLISKRGHRVA